MFEGLKGRRRHSTAAGVRQMAGKQKVARIGAVCLWVWAGVALAEPPAGNGAAANDNPDVIELLKKADAATRAVRAVEYEGELFGTGALKDQISRVKGALKVKHGRRSLLDAVAGRASSSQVLRFDGSIKLPGIDEPIVVKIVTDGKQVYCLNETDKTFVQGESAQVRSLLNAVKMFQMREYLFPTPFSDEIEAKFVRYEGTKKIGKVKCDVVFVVYQDDSKSRWYFGRDDYLPRQVDRLARPSLWGRRTGRLDGSDAPTESAYVIKITSLNVQPTLSAEDFVLTRPKGFETKKYGADRGRSEDRPNLLKPGVAAPDWELAGPDGKVVSLKSLRGKVVLMEFWATWCGPCKLAMPSVQRLHARFKDEPVAVIGISTWEQNGDPAGLMKEKGFEYGLLLKGDKVAEVYQVRGTPTFYVIGPDGTVLYATTGYEPRTEEELAESIEAGLAGVKETGGE